jgi:hypothetical protein
LKEKKKVKSKIKRRSPEIRAFFQRVDRKTYIKIKIAQKNKFRRAFSLAKSSS